MACLRKTRNRIPRQGSNEVHNHRGKRYLLEAGGARGGAVAVDLEQIAAELRGRLTADECRRLGALLAERPNLHAPTN
jgi:hypothetical protein